MVKHDGGVAASLAGRLLVMVLTVELHVKRHGAEIATTAGKYRLYFLGDLGGLLEKSFEALVGAAISADFALETVCKRILHAPADALIIGGALKCNFVPCAGLAQFSVALDRSTQSRVLRSEQVNRGPCSTRTGLNSTCKHVSQDKACGPWYRALGR